MELFFRKARESEFSTALQLLKQAAQTLQNKQINQWAFWLNPTETQCDWIRAGFTNQEFYFVENIDNQFVAMFRLLAEDELYWGKQSVNARYVHSLVVEKSFAGQQIGSKIIAQIEQDLIEKGIFRFRLDCNASNPVLCAYYEKHGFVKVGEKQMPHSLNNLYEKILISTYPKS
jgi:ribosomal protein S18 acetylase RimI-like enzyme